MSDKVLKLKPYLVFALLCMLLGVVLGAFGAHVFEKYFNQKEMDTFNTALKYQTISGTAILILAIMMQLHWIKTIWSMKLMALGTVLFCGSLYVWIFSKVKFWVHVTPIGGLFMMLAWLCALLDVLSSNRERE